MPAPTPTRQKAIATPRKYPVRLLHPTPCLSSLHVHVDDPFPWAGRLCASAAFGGGARRGALSSEGAQVLGSGARVVDEVREERLWVLE